MPAQVRLLATVSLLALIAVRAHAADAPAGETSVSEVVVTGAPYAVSLDSVTTSVNVITREQLETQPQVGLGDALSGLPGLRSTFYGPGASRPVIRGLSGPRVLILQNGVGLVDASSLSPDHAVATEPGEASRIEVLRGPSTLAYGGSAIGGVVNIIDDRVPSTKPVNGFESHGAVSAGSVDDSYAISGGVKAAAGDWVVALEGAKRASEDYRVASAPVSQRYLRANDDVALSGNVVRNTDVRLEDYGGGLSYVGDEGYIGASIKRTTSRYGLPFPQIVLDTTPEEGPVFIDLKQTRIDLRGERVIDLGLFDKARFSIGYADYKHAEIAVDTHEVGTQFLSEGAEGRVELVQREQDGWQGAVGAQTLTRSFEAIGDEAFVPPADVDEIGVFTVQRLDKDAWGIEGGLRIDRRRIDAALRDRPSSGAAQGEGVDWSEIGERRTFTNLSASGAVFMRPTEGLFLSLALAHNQRAPTEFELFADGPHPGTGGYELGDPTLKSEKVDSAELTARRAGDRGRLEAHVYVARYGGYIDETATGDRAGDDGELDPDGELPVFHYVQTNATFYGGELEGAYALWRPDEGKLSLEGAYDYVHGRTSNGPPARIPPWSLTGRLVWEAERWDTSAEVRYVAEQDRTAAFELPTGAYVLVNAKASFKPLADRNVRLFVEARNLTDATAREHASFLKDIAPLPGRTIRGGITFSF